MAEPQDAPALREGRKRGRRQEGQAGVTSEQESQESGLPQIQQKARFPEGGNEPLC